MSENSLKIIRSNELAEILSVSLSTIYKWAESGELPPRVKLGPRAIGWRRSDIEAFIADRMETESYEAA